jgi:glycosyltransferase involved in cell wall biosynthesis
VPSRPSATVVIPCYNHGRFVADAVRSALAQQDADVRVVVVDDGSDDGASPDCCLQAARLDPRVRHHRQPNAGLPAARNAGARLAREDHPADYLVFLDADDWIEPAFVARLHDAVAREGDDAVSHAYCQERLVEKGSGVWAVPEWDPLLLLVTNLHPVTALIRRDRFEAAGGFDETLRTGYEDWDLWLRFAERSWRGVRVREPLFVWRRHSDQTMVMHAAKRHAELLSAVIDRHPALYEPNARRVIELSNVLLRRADANWLDENGEAIYVRDLRARNCELFDELETAQAKVRELRELVDEYERKPSVRVARAVFRVVDAMPRPLAEPVRALARWARRAL